MNKGMIFNIQKFSIHDGPGIRTTVFLKGCPLKCQWCSNPESQLDHIQILYDYDKCIHCQQCVHVCPHGALTHHEIVKTCLQDKDFYEESDGGVTISGGEGMSQPDFVKALVNKLKDEDIHVAIETTGYIQPQIFQDLALLFDLLLFDVKHYDSEQHFLGTAVHNELIIQNLQWAIDQGIEVLPRIPVIPDFNASLEDAKGLAKLLQSVGAKRVQLLPFHQFGEKKYELLNRDYHLKNKKALHKEDLQDYQNIFLEQGLDCFF